MPKVSLEIQKEDNTMEDYTEELIYLNMDEYEDDEMFDDAEEQ